MSDNIKLIIEIPREVRNRLTFGVAYKNDLQILAKALSIGTPLSEILDEIKGEIQRKIDMYDDRSISEYEDCLAIIDKHIGKAESEVKPNDHNKV